MEKLRSLMWGRKGRLLRSEKLKMREIEVKILGINRKDIEKKLRSMGAKKVFDGKIDALFFDFDDNAIKKAKNTLRLRKEGDIAKLTFKEHISRHKAKIKKEHEVEVSDFESIRTILKSLGLRVWKKATKRRVSYELKGTRFEFDKYIGKYRFIPEFMEIEASDVKTIYRYARLLGFKDKDCRPWSTSDVSRHYSKKKR